MYSWVIKEMYYLCRKLMWKKEFDTSYVGFMKDGAQWLVDNTDIKLVGKLGPFLLEGNNIYIYLFCKKKAFSKNIC